MYKRKTIDKVEIQGGNVQTYLNQERMTWLIEEVAKTGKAKSKILCEGIDLLREAEHQHLKGGKRND